jgi:RNA polymerase sigma-70 factor, ECF subfamily
VGDEDLVARLTQGDERAFASLVARYHMPMLRLALTFVPNRAIAEDVVQDTWIAVLRGIDRFDGRSSLKTWLFRILVNRAHTTGAQERRTTPVEPAGMAAVDAARFGPDGSWADPPAPWTDLVEDRLIASAMIAQVRALIADLPDAQRQVVTLRDVEGLSADDVCSILGLTPGNQRVLLHRARSRLRSQLERQYDRKGG